jgi:hypothetical protein
LLYTPSYSETLLVIDTAAILRGTVTAIFLLPIIYPAYIRYLGIWVVLPEPVSAVRITTLWLSKA